MLAKPAVWQIIVVTVAVAIGMFIFVFKGHRALGRTTEFVLFVGYLVLLRRFILELRAWQPAPIEVRPLEYAADSNPPKAPPDRASLYAAFCEDLARPRLYHTTSVPGDPEPDRIYDVLKSSTGASGWRGLLSAAYAYAIPSRAYIVTATLRTRAVEPKYGLTVHVRRLPKPAVELETQWSHDFPRAVRRGAYAAAAYIIPYTRACLKAPWSEWYGKSIPVDLFRDYHRAKRMVTERRYDEALRLYHTALIHDGDNVDIRYDIAQVYERLQMYPDALAVYIDLVDRIFPIRRARRHNADVAEHHVDGRAPAAPSPSPDAETASQSPSPRPKVWERVASPTWWPNTDRDPFSIRYRYITVLSFSARLAEQLLGYGWLSRQGVDAEVPSGGVDDGAPENRPWRLRELADLRYRIADRLDGLRSTEKLDDLLGPHMMEVQEENDGASTTCEPGEKNALNVQSYFLRLAQYEAELLERDFDHYRRLAWIRRSRKSRLTKIVVRQLVLLIKSRIDQVDTKLQASKSSEGSGAAGALGPRTEEPCPEPDKESRSGLEKLQKSLVKTGYSDASPFWQEHYNAACLFSLPLLDDDKESPAHSVYARTAVAALDRAVRCGDEVEFAKSKRYWLQAGDPDLSGLRVYECFRAFEARVWVIRSPSTRNIWKYELYQHLQAVLAHGSQIVERVWQRRSTGRVPAVTPGTFEDWWRQETHAWLLAIRLGKFYMQWQTRQAMHLSIRDWATIYGGLPLPLPYPDLIRDEYLPDIGDEEFVRQKILATEEMMRTLGRDLGSLVHRPGDGTSEPSESDSLKAPGALVKNTAEWMVYAEECSRANTLASLSDEAFRDLCNRRAGLWAALRQWASEQSYGAEAEFLCAIGNLPSRPIAP